MWISSFGKVFVPEGHALPEGHVSFMPSEHCPNRTIRVNAVSPSPLSAFGQFGGVAKWVLALVSPHCQNSWLDQFRCLEVALGLPHT